MKRRKSAFLRVIEERREAARQQSAPEETNEREVPDAQTPRSRFLLPDKNAVPTGVERSSMSGERGGGGTT
jgi:hypothetical protein